MLYNIYIYDCMYLSLTLRIYLDLSGKSKSKRQICWIAILDQLISFSPLRLCGPFPQPERAHDGPEQWTPWQLLPSGELT